MLEVMTALMMCNKQLTLINSMFILIMVGMVESSIDRLRRVPFVLVLQWCELRLHDCSTQHKTTLPLSGLVTGCDERCDQVLVVKQMVLGMIVLRWIAKRCREGTHTIVGKRCTSAEGC